MRSQYISRSPEVDTDKCVVLSGGNRFDMVIMAAARAREIKRQHAHSQSFEHVHSNITALLEFQEGKLDQNYMKKVKFSQPNDHRIDRRAQYK